MNESSNGKGREPSTTAKLSIQCMEDSKRWFPDVAPSLPHHVLSLAGEVGELANLVKKIERGSLSFKDAKVRFDVAMEVTDVYIYLLNTAALLNIDLEQAYAVKRAENIRRFGVKPQLDVPVQNGVAGDTPTG
jgi:NTP pyrophosphatase (non-canonical NTP hydrolase)